MHFQLECWRHEPKTNDMMEVVPRVACAGTSHYLELSPDLLMSSWKWHDSIVHLWQISEFVHEKSVHSLVIRMISETKY